MGGRIKPESGGGCFDVQELTRVLRSEVMDDLRGEEQNLEV